MTVSLLDLRAMKLRAVLAVGLLSCSKPAASPTTAPPPGGDPSNRVESNRVAELVHAAEEALRDETPVDYERPYAKPWSGRSRATKLFGEACDAGDRPSCWKAFSIAAETERPAIAKLLETQCLGEDLLSCRALVATPEQQFATAPGAAGRSESTTITNRQRVTAKHSVTSVRRASPRAARL